MSVLNLLRKGGLLERKTKRDGFELSNQLYKYTYIHGDIGVVAQAFWAALFALLAWVGLNFYKTDTPTKCITTRVRCTIMFKVSSIFSVRHLQEFVCAYALSEGLFTRPIHHILLDPCVMRRYVVGVPQELLLAQMPSQFRLLLLLLQTQELWMYPVLPTSHSSSFT